MGNNLDYIWVIEQRQQNQDSLRNVFSNKDSIECCSFI